MILLLFERVETFCTARTTKGENHDQMFGRHVLAVNVKVNENNYFCQRCDCEKCYPSSLLVNNFVSQIEHGTVGAGGGSISIFGCFSGCGIGSEGVGKLRFL